MPVKIDAGSVVSVASQLLSGPLLLILGKPWLLHLCPHTSQCQLLVRYPERRRCAIVKYNCFYWPVNCSRHFGVLSTLFTADEKAFGGAPCLTKIVMS